jgi:hypothetical protein
MPSSEMWRHVTLVRSDDSEERVASIIRVRRISELETTLAVTSNRSTLRRNTFLRIVGSYKSTRGHITEDELLQGYFSFERIVSNNYKTHTTGRINNSIGK